MDPALLIGYLASACSVASFMPQVWKVIKTRDTAAISGFALWSVFGIMRGEWPIIVTNSICFCLSGYILFRKLQT